ncbi:hypothetical protein Bhyg_11513 [Pseudolycoriella hygida]|uniref:Uncharacterized protein n=1 Tax=Pseudolycoriella hygida TaxID=35572 RepID=A0A9Q0RYF2_9DIPT|nr:hypothetical protein Bhyg_11513 [Pseudolycoriella hygida]
MANPFDIIKYDVIKDADTKLETRTIGLHFLLPSPLLFVKGKLMLQCTARIHDLYYSEVIKFIEEDRPQVYFPSLSYLSDEEYNQRNEMEMQKLEKKSN